MGLDRTIRFPTTETPHWESIRAQLARVGISASFKMIDGLPAFPDEIPEPGWKELRLGVDGGMVTIRRGHGLFNCIIWGNADDSLQLAWSKVIWACASAGSGMIEMPTGTLSPDEFAEVSGLSKS
jgi:hypothetical protein